MDVIAYCADTAELIAEIESIDSSYIYTDENGDKSIMATKTPTIRNGLETLSIVRNLPISAAQLVTLQIIGHIEYTETGPVRVMGTELISQADAEAIYDRIYPRTPIDTGDGVMWTPPDLFGAFL